MTLDQTTKEEYDKRFSEEDKGRLAKYFIPPNIANNYLKIINAEVIILLYQGSINPKSISNELQEKLNTIFTDKRYTSKKPPVEHYDIIGTGSQSVVLLDKEKEIAIKIYSDEDIGSHEENLLSSIKLNNKKLSHVVSFIDWHYVYSFGTTSLEHFFVTEIQKATGKKPSKVESPNSLNFGLELPYIVGISLETYLRKYRYRINTKSILRISSEIIKGIQELRKGRVHHNDLHDRNILISKYTEQAIIIDLSVGCDYDHSWINSKNRAYGGNNDLISLGQLMYKMTTGHNLFNEGPGFTCYSEVKNRIKTQREKVYDNPKLKLRYLNKVRIDVKNKVLARIITTLLDDDLWKQPNIHRVEEAKKMFEEYTK